MGQDVYLFRKLQHNSLVSVDQHQHLIDIHECGDQTSTSLTKGRTDSDTNMNPSQVQFIWDDMNISSVSRITRLHIKLENADDHRLWFSSDMIRDDFHNCRQLLKLVYGLGGLQVVRFDPRNAWFDILHDDEPSFSKLKGKEAESLVLGFLKDRFEMEKGKEIKIEINMDSLSEVEHKELSDELKLKQKFNKTYNKFQKDMEFLQNATEEQRNINDHLNKFIALLKEERRHVLPKQPYHPVDFSDAINSIVRKLADSLRVKQTKGESGTALKEESTDDKERTEMQDISHQSDIDEGAVGGDTKFSDKKMALLQTFQSRDDPISKRYCRTLERNYGKESSQKSAHSLCTVLCLDSSESMKGKPLEDLKKIALQIVDGIEENAEINELEENLAVVTIAGEVNIAQPLTNDYTQVREAIVTLDAKGRTPLHESFIVCLCALEGGYVPNMNGVHQIRPRLIFITDGKPTDETQHSGPDIEEQGSRSKFAITKTVSDMGRSTEASMPKPITWIPVGDANKQFLTGLAKLCKEKLSSQEDIPRICRHYVIQDGIGKVFGFVLNERKRYEHDVEAIEAITNGVVSNLKPGESRQIVEGVLEKLKHHSGHDTGDPVAFDNVYESSDLPALGNRVMRGPDWKWDDQDHNGLGTIINHDKNDKWLWVEWDGGRWNRYNYSPENGYDVLLVDTPRDPTPGGLQIGVRVERGPDWHHGNEDGGEGSTGVVIRKHGQAQVKVRWGKENIKDYNFGGNEKYEISCCGDLTSRRKRPEKRAEMSSQSNEPYTQSEPIVEEPGEGTLMWQYEDDLQQWRLYPDPDQEKINKTFARKRNGSCLVVRGGVSYRILLQEMTEKEVNGEGRRRVQKVWMNDQELSNRKKLEALIS